MTGKGKEFRARGTDQEGHLRSPIELRGGSSWPNQSILVLKFWETSDIVLDIIYRFTQDKSVGRQMNGTTFPPDSQPLIPTRL